MINNDYTQNTIYWIYIYVEVKLSSNIIKDKKAKCNSTLIRFYYSVGMIKEQEMKWTVVKTWIMPITISRITYKDK